MALSLLQNYDTDTSSDSDSEDELIKVTIDKSILSGKRPLKTVSNSVKKFKGNLPSPNTISQQSNLRPVEASESASDAGIPLPASINAMFNERSREIVHDDPSLHGGRIRSFGHEKNNWATYVYIDLLDCDLEEAKNFILSELELEPVEQHHVSISRVVSLRHHWIDPLVESLRQTVERSKPFPLSLNKLQVYCNDDKTRTFVGLETTAGVQDLQRLTYGVDKCLKEYNLPPFYYPPSFHVSLGWCLGDMRAPIKTILQKVELKLVDILEDDDELGKLIVRNIHCKAGNKIFEFKLK